MKNNKLQSRLRMVALAASAFGCAAAHAFTFGNDEVQGSLDSTVTVGTGIRVKSPACDLILQGASGPGAPAGCLAPTSLMGDQGDLNYARGDAFTTYLKGDHELLLKMPSQQVTFMGRVDWLKDFTATDTTGITSAGSPPPPAVVNGLAEDARKDLNFKPRLLDLWVSKTFDVGGEQARVRIGNQVVSWGESLFIPGGINSTNALDFMRLSQPGTQLKEAVLPAPMVSVASGLGRGLNMEAYWQAAWNSDYLPPTGSYWSVVNGAGKGAAAYGVGEHPASNSGQWGAALRWQPEGVQLNLGLYAMNYHDKAPQFHVGADGFSMVYPEDRKLYGVSANFPLGDWAIGTELSYRPRDAVALNPLVSGCASQDGNCFVEEKRYQWHLTGLYSMMPGNAKGFLDLLGADSATFLGELAVISYPHLKQSYNGDPVSAGAWGWGTETDPSSPSRPVGTRNSSGFAMDFSWVYDGTLVPGWQVTPEIYYFRALSGRTPNVMGVFMEGAQSANLALTFRQNPATWQFGINYTAFWGGSSVFDQPLRDRNFVGVYLARNF